MSPPFIIRTLDQVRVIADPLRLRILEALCEKGAMTAKQVAQSLGENTTRLYHHVNLLEKAGLVRLVSTRKNRGTIEKYFEAVAGRFEVEQGLFDITSDNESSARIVGDISAAGPQSLRPHDAGSYDMSVAAEGTDEHEAIFAKLGVMTSSTRIRSIREKVKSVVEELEKAANETGNTPYAFKLAFFPVKAGPKQTAGIRQEPKGPSQSAKGPDPPRDR